MFEQKKQNNPNKSGKVKSNQPDNIKLKRQVPGSMVKRKAGPTLISDGVKKKNGFINFAESFIRLYRLIFLLVVIIVLLAVSYGGYWLYKVNIVEWQGLIEKKQQTLDIKEQELNQLKSIKVSYEDLEDSSKKILQVLPDERDLPSVFVQLEALAYKHNLFLSTVDIAAEQSTGEEKRKKDKVELHKLVINLSLSGGDYFTLKNFLNDVENNLRLLDIRSIVYSPEGNTYNISMNTYYFGEGYAITQEEE
ncbi:type 4a pilus biogenesis protein PilO [Candidatus Falkowbacteria bacterium]|jgi:Tfp pilus assembly protein PilO|nr:type 4a pilus biogenesis protein PilO [Candidatus Falkowbacteria bacterium]MBT5503307.1 type 4a pilus biogenesis protein PilO [Candidatus Falkowbacteria bacterium]MBT6573639.1 type 4a pilus biogenesis protein PilO [Candidatus Falkowbacteria bacterium]MBT7349157.1 type 4a pilus biogenesis protein PilO [Candidatus Falkowbacteria bacterium]MBT7500110.1 type 4a pilus biogenesis protein PilO [Candidatus Falkowbacteria bacterium]